MGIRLKVNGVIHEVDVEPDAPLLWVIRDELGLTGTKFGCGIAACGACTVHVNGRAVRSCRVPVGSVADAQITTIEGLGASGLNAVQQAWIEEQTPLCGFCQSGMMIKATELLERVTAPSVAEIKEAFTTSGPSPHLCRCGSYTAIIAAVQFASSIMAKGGAR